eukprot:scaffold4463_cov152-Skeletonema_marinoi.AAC.8
MKQLLTLTLLEVAPSLSDGCWPENFDTLPPTYRDVPEEGEVEPPLVEMVDDGYCEYEAHVTPPKKYSFFQLPWNLKVAYKHPIFVEILIYPTADWPHGVLH